ncbi:MAG: hypothetical protein H6922_02500 [Pseudomonadaceae bacterium]|nr:hypothetical protein [Pseudomonadaceae bacterium]
MTYGSDMSLEQRVAKIDLTRVMQHVQEDTGMPAEMLVRAEDLYRKFLVLVGKYGKPMVPPVLVDHVWHAHITFTRQYMADCEFLFGEYLHHEPADGEGESEECSSLFNVVTVEKYQSEFGMNLYAVDVPAGLMVAADCGKG